MAGHRKGIDAATDAWLQQHDPAFFAQLQPKADALNRAMWGRHPAPEDLSPDELPRPEEVISSRSGRSGRHRQHVPAGYRSIGEGWLIREPAGSIGDVAIAAAVFKRASGGKANGDVGRRLDAVAARAATRWMMERLRDLPASRKWRPMLEFQLAVEACCPERFRGTAKEIAERLAAVWVGLGPNAPPLPDFANALRNVAGDRLQRLTPADRGGGRGPAARVSVARTVKKIARFVADQEALALARFRVLTLRQLDPDLSLRRISESGGDPRMLRRAVALLEREGVIKR